MTRKYDKAITDSGKNLEKQAKEALRHFKVHFRKKHKKKNKRKGRRTDFTYKEYIHSPLWAQRKQRYYQKHEKKCVACGTDYLVGLHHLSYDHLGDEPDEDLVPLCWGCHRSYHERFGNKNIYANNMTHITEIQEEEELSAIVRNL